MGYSFSHWFLRLLVYIKAISPRFSASLKGLRDHPSGSDCKEPACNVGDMGLIPGLGKSPGEGNGNPLQFSCLGNPMQIKPGRLTVCGVTESDTTERLTRPSSTVINWRNPFNRGLTALTASVMGPDLPSWKQTDHCYLGAPRPPHSLRLLGSLLQCETHHVICGTNTLHTHLVNEAEVKGAGHKDCMYVWRLSFSLNYYLNVEFLDFL